MASYLITVFTGTRVAAGTDGIVTMVIKGTNGETGPLHLDTLFYNDFEPGHADEYHRKANDVGEPLMVKMTIVFGGLLYDSPNDWFVEKVTVKDKGRNITHTFPCYRWVQSEVVIFKGTAKLPTDDQHANVRSQRADELTWRRSLFQWGDDAAYLDMPGYMKAKNALDLPKDVRFTHEAQFTLVAAGSQGLLNLGLMHLQNVFDDWENFEEYHKTTNITWNGPWSILYVSPIVIYTLISWCFWTPKYHVSRPTNWLKHIYIGFIKTFTCVLKDVPQASEYWREDNFFGSQFLNGCNPDVIERCTQLPANFPVTQKLVGNLLDSGDTLESAMANGRLYIVDYKILEDIPCWGQNQKCVEKRYMCASLGLFYVKSNGDLVPIAIQFHQKPSSSNPIWTPNDAEMDWIAAKLWLRNSDSQVHQMITHLLRTHLFMEPVAVASNRQLPCLHPLWKLLAPHIKGIIAINTFGRDILIPAGGIADILLSVGGGGHIDLMKKFFRTTSWDKYNLPKNLKERGLDDVDKLPNFYFRDETLDSHQSICRGNLGDLLSLR